MGPTKEEVEAAAEAIKAAKINGQRQLLTDEYAAILARAALIAASRAREAGDSRNGNTFDRALEFSKGAFQSFGLSDDRMKVYAAVIAELIDGAIEDDRASRSPSPAGAMREALEWYGSETEAIATRLHGKRVSQEYHAVEASLTVLALDGGKRASTALSTPSVPALDREAVIEECAKVAESVAVIQSDACFADFARDIAAHIRALSHPSPEGG